jgi:hypothetical protein
MKRRFPTIVISDTVSPALAEDKYFSPDRAGPHGERSYTPGRRRRGGAGLTMSGHTNPILRRLDSRQ